jgi:hypothetical protein
MGHFLKATFVWLILVAAVITLPVCAAPKQVIQPDAKEQTFPPMIQQERKQEIKLADLMRMGNGDLPVRE